MASENRMNVGIVLLVSLGTALAPVSAYFRSWRCE